jgi:exodeoxyribonuclease VII small subunit
MSDKSPKSEEAPQPSFREAMDELEAILERIEGEEVDIDRLAEELRRAAQLLEICRGKIRRAEVEVTQIVQSLEDEKPGAEVEAPDGET